MLQMRPERASREPVLTEPGEGRGLFFSIGQYYSAFRTRLKEARKAKRRDHRRAQLADADGVPTWFNPHLPPSLAEPADRPCVVFQSHITGHTNKLLVALEDEHYDLVDLELVIDIGEYDVRQQVIRFAFSNPAQYTALVLSKLARVKRKISLAIVTFDWNPAPRQIAAACSELGIPTVLVPHEGVFADRARYYVHQETGIGAPICDLVLCWGRLQQSIFASRGYPSGRMVVTGAPKFDYLAQLQHGTINRSAVTRLGLDPHRQVIVFAMQWLDSQFDKPVARAQQSVAVRDTLDAAASVGAQVIVRAPTAGAQVLSDEVVAEIAGRDDVAIDGRGEYQLTPEETITVADVVVSINSTMLLEAALAGRVAISAKYVEFEQVWDGLRIAVARDRAAMMTMVREAVSDPGRVIGGYDTAWAARELSATAFDGRAAQRIRSILREILDGKRMLRPFNDGESFVSSERPSIGTAGLWRESVLASSHSYLGKLLDAERLIVPTSDKEALAVEVMLQWGLMPSPSKQRLARFAELVLRPLLYLEDGFLRSVAIGLERAPGLSIILDDKTLYYDSSQPSRLEIALESPTAVASEELVRARRAIAAIGRGRVSKYNHAPDHRVVPAAPGLRTILLVDQRFGDASVEFGIASETSFRRMLDDALADPDARVIAKLHPDAIGGGKGSYLGPLVAERSDPRLVVIDYDLNPHALFDVVDDVWVATSGLGFEALMAGKRVRCYGVPYYAGWGVTEDMTPCPRRTRRRTVEEIFAVAWLRLSRYMNPATGERGEIEDVIEFLAAAVRARGTAVAAEERPAIDLGQVPRETAPALAASRGE